MSTPSLICGGFLVESTRRLEVGSESERRNDVIRHNSITCTQSNSTSTTALNLPITAVLLEVEVGESSQRGSV